MKVEMEDWDLRRQPIHEAQVIVVGSGAEVRMAHIQAHPHVEAGREASARMRSKSALNSSGEW